jgi:molybdate/tungstate transport system permease protein
MFPRASRSGAGDGAGTRIGWPAVAGALGTLLLAFYAVPLAVLLVRAPEALDAAGPAVVDAARTSLLTASASTALATALGVPLAYRLARAEFRGKRAVTGLVALPLVLPPVVSGLLLLSAFGPAGLGIEVAGTHVGVVLAQTFVASPFVVVVGQAAFEGVDPRLEAASRTLGAGRFRTFRRVTLPLAAPGVIAGVTLAFARSMGEFGATLLLAYYPRTLPVEIWVAFRSRGVDAALPVAVVLLAVAAGALALLGSVGGAPWSRAGD